MGIQLQGEDQGPLTGPRISNFRQDDPKATAARWRRFLRDWRFQPETPPLLAKDPALILRANTIAPVFNDEEKRARGTTQVHELARERYRFDVGGLAFWAGCDRATTLVAGARHVGGFPHGMCQLSHKRFAPSLRGVGAGCRTEVVASDPFRLPGGIGINGLTQPPPCR